MIINSMLDACATNLLHRSMRHRAAPLIACVGAICVWFFPSLSAHSQHVRVTTFPATVYATDSVRFAFKVLWEDGRYLDYVPREAIELSDNGTSIHDYAIRHTTPPGIDSTYVVLLLDISGSMRYQGKLQRLKGAAQALLRTLSPNDNCALIGFASEAHTLSTFSNDTSFLRTRIDALQPSTGYTALYDALYQALLVLSPLAPETHKTILLITDGIEEGSTYLSGADIGSKFDAVKNLSVHTFDISAAPKAELKRLAMLGNGSYTFRPNPEEVFFSFERFFAHYKKAIVIQYAIPTRDTSRHRTLSCSLVLDKLPLRIVLDYQVPPPPDQTLESVLIVLAIMCVLAFIAWLALRQRKRQGHHGPPRENHDSHREVYLDVETAAAALPAEPQSEQPLEALQDPERDERTVFVQGGSDNPTTALGYLVLYSSRTSNTLFEISREEVLIGRGSQCDIHLDNAEVSRVHAKIRVSDEGFILFDAGSGNGTQVNGQDISRTVLHDGDMIAIGGNTLVFKEVRP